MQGMRTQGPRLKPGLGMQGLAHVNSRQGCVQGLAHVNSRQGCMLGLAHVNSRQGCMEGGGQQVLVGQRPEVEIKHITAPGM